MSLPFQEFLTHPTSSPLNEITKIRIKVDVDKLLNYTSSEYLTS